MNLYTHETLERFQPDHLERLIKVLEVRKAKASDTLDTIGKNIRIVKEVLRNK